jgi:Mrp family chromosome partitioning ATPase/capsular polysaccharide biosynthesis protein
LTEESRPTTLRDQLAFVVRRWLLVVTLAAVCAGLAVAFTKTQSKSYTATASLRAHDPTQDFPAAGLPQAFSDQLPSQLASQAASLANQPDVLQQVKKRLHLKETTSEISNRISSSSDATSGLAQIGATANTPKEAADLANATANAVASVSNTSTQKDYARLAGRLRQQVARLQRQLPKNIKSLTPDQRDSYQNNLRQQAVLGEQAARLGALSAVTQPVQVSEHAVPPASSNVRSPLHNGLIGAGVGLVLGLIAAWFMDRHDRRLRRPEEVEELLGLPVVGALRRGLLGRSSVAAESPESSVATMETFRAARNNMLFLGREHRPRSVLVTSPLSQEGKTTVSTGIAVAAAASGLRVLLVEADLHRPVHAKRLAIDSKPGLADYLKGEAEPRDILHMLRFTDPAVARARNGASLQPSGNGKLGELSNNGAIAELPQSILVCIPAGNARGLSIETIGSSLFSAFIDQVTSVYDLVIIDSAPLLGAAETLQIVPLVDTVLYCVRLGQTTRDQAVAGYDLLRRAPERQVGVMITDLVHTEGPYRYYSYAYDYGIDDFGASGGRRGSRKLLRA